MKALKRHLKSAKPIVAFFLRSDFLRRLLRRGLQISSKATGFALRAQTYAIERVPLHAHQISEGSATSDFEVFLRYYKSFSGIYPQLIHKPLFSILVIWKGDETQGWVRAIKSVFSQIYPKFEIILVSPKTSTETDFSQFNSLNDNSGPSVKVRSLSPMFSMQDAWNEFLREANGDYGLVLDDGEVLLPNALSEFARAINLYKQPRLIYCDHEESESVLKPRWSMFFQMSSDYVAGTFVFAIGRTKSKVIGSRSKNVAELRYDIVLDAMDLAKGGIESLPQMLWKKTQTPQSGLQRESLDLKLAELGTGLCTKQVNSEDWFCFENKELKTPKVSIIIPSRNAYDLVKRCLDSVFQLTQYSNFEVILVDNGSDCEKCKAFFKELSSRYLGKFSVVYDGGPFNFARLNNFGVSQAKGEFLVLLNNDTQVFTSTWLEELLAFARLDNVGAVGCKLLFDQRTIQHAGIVLSAGFTAIHAGMFEDRNSKIYKNYFNRIHEVSAVTAACMMIEKHKYEAVGGLDELWLPNGYGDVDFCLRLKQKGFLTLYTPYAELMHLESPSRKANIEYFEREILKRKWPSEVLQDPFLNPQLSGDGLYSRVDSQTMPTPSEEMLRYFNAEKETNWSSSTFQKFRGGRGTL